MLNVETRTNTSAPPSQLSPGQSANNQAIVAAGPGYTAAMPQNEINKDGLTNTGSSAIQAGDIRPGNATPSNTRNIVNELRDIADEISNNNGLFEGSTVLSTNESASRAGVQRYSSSANSLLVASSKNGVTIQLEGSTSTKNACKLAHRKNTASSPFITCFLVWHALNAKSIEILLGAVLDAVLKVFPVTSSPNFGECPVSKKLRSS